MQVGRGGNYIQFWLSDGGSPPEPDTMLWEDAMHGTPVVDGLHEYAVEGEDSVLYEVVRVITRHTKALPLDVSPNEPLGLSPTGCVQVVIAIVKGE